MASCKICGKSENTMHCVCSECMEEIQPKTDCDFCKVDDNLQCNKIHFDGGEDGEVDVQMCFGKIEIIHKKGNETVFHLDFDINYCPMCGRKLREEKTMTINEYQKEAMRTARGRSSDYPLILNGLMGLNGEAGECIDLLKKFLFQGHEFDREHMAKELGDCAWYLAVSAHALGYDLETILQMNVDKLRKRYPNGFETGRSQNRNEEDL